MSQKKTFNTTISSTKGCLFWENLYVYSSISMLIKSAQYFVDITLRVWWRNLNSVQYWCISESMMRSTVTWYWTHKWLSLFPEPHSGVRADGNWTTSWVIFFRSKMTKKKNCYLKTISKKKPNFFSSIFNYWIPLYEIKLKQAS